MKHLTDKYKKPEKKNKLLREICHFYDREGKRPRIQY